MLKNGIIISSVQFDFLKLEQLYIKLDKKLILRAKNITINENNSSKNESLATNEILQIAKNLKYLYTFVEEIDIKELTIKDKHIRILFKDNEFFVDNELLFLKLGLEKNEELKARIKKLLLKDYNLSVEGNLNINVKSEFYHFLGRVSGDLLDFNLSLSYKNKGLSYKLENLNIKDISKLFKKLEKKLEIPASLNTWLTQKARGEFYHLDILQGFADFSKDNYYLNDIQALAYVENVKIKLDDKMNPIEIPRLDLNLSKQRLDFSFKKASYNGADLSSSKVYLYDIFTDDIGIYLKLKTSNFIFDEKLANALKDYNFSLPFYQKSGKLSSDLELKIDFKENGNALYNGILSLENANISLADFNITKAFAKLKQNELSLENASVKNNFLEADFNASLDFNAKKGIFDTKISRFFIENGEILDLKNEEARINLDFLDEVRLEIPRFNADLKFKDGLKANINNASFICENSAFFKKLGISNIENISYESLDFEDFNASVNGVLFDNNLFMLDNTPYKKDDFELIKEQGVMSVNSKSNLISASVKDSKKEIHLKNLIYIYKNDDKNSFDLASNNEIIKIGGANVGVILQDSNKTLMFDKLELDLNKDILNLTASRFDANLRLFYSSEDIKLEFKNLKEQNINEFLQKQAVQNGIFNLSINGSSLEYFDGEFNFKDTFVKDLKGINQLVSFIDTVPSLLMFKSPTFNQKGLSLHEGKILFNRKKDLFNVSAINLNGDSVDIYGLGYVNLRLKNINIDLELKTLKSASEAISKVPILNYVILGKNQVISTNLKMDGELENPKFHTQILSDTLKTPFNLIKNILQLPANLFN